MKRQRLIIGAFLIVLIIAMCACDNGSGKNDTVIGNDVLMLGKGDEKASTSDREDGVVDIVAVITGVDTSKKTLNAKTVVLEGNHSEYNASQKEYALKYSGSTDIKDAYGKAISAGQLKCGNIVNVVYDSNTDKIESIEISKEFFEIKGVTGVNVSKTGKTLAYGKSTYSYSDYTLAFDKEDTMNISDVSPEDVITLRGIGNKVYSITLEKGHGTIKLSGYTQFLGGYIEIGDSKVLKVVEDMSITVTEGTYRVIISKGDVTATRNITVERGKTALAEFDEYLQNPAKQGSIEFVLKPDNAKLYVDGVKVDTKELVALTYGVHTFTVVATGYDNYIATFVVDSPYEKLTIDMDNNSSKNESTTKQNSSTKSQTTTKASSSSTTRHQLSTNPSTTSVSNILDKLFN